MSIINLTRTIRPPGARLASESLNYMRTMPEWQQKCHLCRNE